MAFHFLFSLLISATCLCAVSSVSPVDKVVELLNKLDAELGEEGKRDAAQYDKYACFCKEQADQRNYDIEQSNEKVERLGVEVTDLEAKIAQLNTAMSELGIRITKLENEMKEMVAGRTKEHDAYLLAAKDADESIKALAAGVRALRMSKQQMADKSLDMVQLRVVLGPKAAALLEEESSVNDLLGSHSLGSQEPNKYEYQSDNIIAMLQTLIKNFKEDKANLDSTEFQARSEFDIRFSGSATEKGFALKELSEKKQVLGTKTENMHSSQANKDAETQAKEADQAYMDELTAECDRKADEWDERSQTRSSELAAISQAVELVESGVVQNYDVNRKLVGLPAERVLVHKGRTFLQVLSGATSHNEDLRRRVIGLLSGAAQRSGSAELSALAKRMGDSAGADPFVKIRWLVKNLISKLEGDATAEAETKGFCDKELGAAIKSRDKAQSDIEGISAKIEQQTAEKAEKIEEISQLTQDIADAHKALNEGTQLRNDDQEMYEQTVRNANEGKSATAQAIDILSKLLKEPQLTGPAAAHPAPDQGVTFVQYTPQNSDRSGKTVSDRAPEISKKQLQGAKIAVQGIVGMLEVILSDFERTLAKTEKEETEAKQAFAKFEAETKANIDSKKQESKDFETDVTSLKESLFDNKDALKDGKEMRSSSLEELSKLQTMCVDGVESWKERREKREQELEALRQALGLLQDFRN